MNFIHLFLGILSLLMPQLNPQPTSPDMARAVVERFFESFHERDTTALRLMFDQTARLQTIVQDANNNRAIRTTTTEEFLNSMAGIPDSLVFEEKLTSFSVLVDEGMAHVWTPYEFYLDGLFSHCGVNSFQLFHNGAEWKIIYLVDTRRKDRCE